MIRVCWGLIFAFMIGVVVFGGITVFCSCCQSPSDIEESPPKKGRKEEGVDFASNSGQREEGGDSDTTKKPPKLPPKQAQQQWPPPGEEVGRLPWGSSGPDAEIQFAQPAKSGTEPDTPPPSAPPSLPPKNDDDYVDFTKHGGY